MQLLFYYPTFFFFLMALKVGVRLKWVANGAQCAYVRVDFKVKTSILSLFLG